MNSPRAAFTWIEALVCVVVVVVLVILLTPNIAAGSERAYMTQVLNNARQFQLATMQSSATAMEIDPHLEWTTVVEKGKAPRPVTLAGYFEALVAQGYMSKADLKKLLTARGIGPGNDAPTAANICFKFFRVRDSSPSDQPLVVTANWTPAGLDPKAAPFRGKGFVVFNKGGGGNLSTSPAEATAPKYFPADPKLGYSTETLK